MDVTAPAAAAAATDTAAAAAGWEMPGDVYRLRFADPEWAGLVVTAREPTAGGQIELTAAGRVDIEGLLAGDLSDAALVQLAAIFRAFADSLVSWNMLKDGSPVPATREGVFGLDLAVAVELGLTWLREVRRHRQQRGEAEAALDLPVDPLPAPVQG